MKLYFSLILFVCYVTVFSQTNNRYKAIVAGKFSEEENTEKAFMHANHIKTKKTYYLNAKNEALGEHPYKEVNEPDASGNVIRSIKVLLDSIDEIADYDTTGNEVSRVNYFFDKEVSGKTITIYDVHLNMVQRSTHNFCSNLAISLNDCHIVTRYEEYYYYDAKQNLILYEDYYPEENKPFNKNKKMLSRREVYKYDTLNRPVEFIIKTGSEKTKVLYTYDKEGNLIKEKRSGDSFEILYKYDVYNRLIEKADKDRTNKYSYDADGRETESIEYRDGLLSGKHSYEYSKQGIVKEIYFTPGGHNDTTTYVYNDHDLLLERTAKDQDGKVTEREKNTYNNKGLLIEKYEFFSSEEWIRKYEYVFY